MYTVASAASNRNTSLDSESWSAWAAPWNEVLMEGGRCTAFSACSISSTAVLNEASGARLNDTVTAGNCARWLMTSGDLVILMSAMPLRGTWPVLPVWVGRYKLPRAWRLGKLSALATNTTRYWLD